MDTAAGGRTAARRAVTVVFAVVTGWLVPGGVGTATALTDSCPVRSDNCTVMTESFESGTGLPPGWKVVEYTPGNSTATVVSGAAADGTHFLRIVSNKPNHVRVVVPVPVTPNTNYRFQAMVKARGTNQRNMAAVLGIDGQYTVTGSVRTDTQWQPLELYVKVGRQTTINLTMGLGHFGQLNAGAADFDAVKVIQVSAIPHGATVADLTPATPSPAPKTAAESTFSQGPNKAIWVFAGILVVGGIGVAVVLLRQGDTESIPQAHTAPRADAESNSSGPASPVPNTHTYADPGTDTQPDQIPNHQKT